MFTFTCLNRTIKMAINVRPFFYHLTCIHSFRPHVHCPCTSCDNGICRVNSPGMRQLMRSTDRKKKSHGKRAKDGCDRMMPCHAFLSLSTRLDAVPEWLTSQIEKTSSRPYRSSIIGIPSFSSFSHYCTLLSSCRGERNTLTGCSFEN